MILFRMLLYIPCYLNGENAGFHVFFRQRCSKRRETGVTCGKDGRSQLNCKKLLKNTVFFSCFHKPITFVKIYDYLGTKLQEIKNYSRTIRQSSYAKLFCFYLYFGFSRNVTFMIIVFDILQFSSYIFILYSILRL